MGKKNDTKIVMGLGLFFLAVSHRAILFRHFLPCGINLVHTCGISLVPYAITRMTRVRRGHRPLGQSHHIYCSILAVAPTGIFCVFSQLLSSSKDQLTYEKDPHIRQTSWPKAAGTKLPTGSTRQSEGGFSTL